MAQALAKTEEARRQELIATLEIVLTDFPDHLGSALRHLPGQMDRLGEGRVGDWVAALNLKGSSVEGGEALLAAESVLGRDTLEAALPGVGFGEVGAYLQHYADAHCGRHVLIESTGKEGGLFSYGGNAMTISLPGRLSLFGDERDALSYRVMAALAIGAIEFGRYDLEWGGSTPSGAAGQDDLDRLFQAQKMPWLAQSLFEELERFRVRAWIRSRYLGLARDIEEWSVALLGLNGRPEEEASLIDEVLHGLQWAWLGEVPSHPLVEQIVEEADACLVAGADVEVTAQLMERFLPDLLDLLPENPRTPSAMVVDQSYQPPMSPQHQEREKSLRNLRTSMREEGLSARLEVIRAAIEDRGAATQDESFAEVLDFLERNPPPDGGLIDSPQESFSPDRGHSFDIGQELSPEGGALYSEWGEDIGDYRPNWVRVREFPIEGGDASFSARVRAEHGPHIDSLRRSFEALRPENYRRVRGETDGDELDLERVVAAQIDRRLGAAVPERLYSRSQRRERSVAVALLMDLSSSTNEPARFGGKRIIDVEKESLVVAAEALDALGDRFAVYGYSGFSREEVAFFIAKTFSEPFNDRVRAQVGGLSFKMENRDGAAIRHAGQKLLGQPARSRVLMLLSDGKPLDCGGPKYNDSYAQEDTRMALNELRQQGVRAFCITVDPRGGEYLADVYGKGNYIVVDDVARLPHLLPKFYQRVAT